MTSMLRPFPVLLLAAVALIGPGCEIRKAMYDQPKYEPYQEATFFDNGSSARELIEGTIARDHLRDDPHYFDGTVDGKLAESFPDRIEVDRAFLDRGRERFNIFCAPCHDQAGTGNGMIVQRGFKQPSSYHVDRLRNMPASYFYSVAKNGFGVMQGYAPQVPVEDRWAIAAYIKALQLSQHADLAVVPEEARAELETAKN